MDAHSEEQLIVEYAEKIHRLAVTALYGDNGGAVILQAINEACFYLRFIKSSDPAGNVLAFNRRLERQVESLHLNYPEYLDALQYAVLLINKQRYARHDVETDLQWLSQARHIPWDPFHGHPNQVFARSSKILPVGAAMRYPVKIHTALAVLGCTRIPRHSYAPWSHRLCWRAGIALTPPHLAGIACNWLLYGAWFTLFWGFFMWFIVWSPNGIPAVTAVMTALATGALFGLIVALGYRHTARKHDLPSWANLKTLL